MVSRVGWSGSTVLVGTHSRLPLGSIQPAFSYAYQALHASFELSARRHLRIAEIVVMDAIGVKTTISEFSGLGIPWQ